LAKIGRNQPCPCGGGKKFKHCHGKFSGGGELPFPHDDVFQVKLQELEADDAQRQKQQGLGKPIISTDFQGQRVVAVGNRVYHSPKWKTFHDFLREYVFMVLGKEWTEKQRKKPPSKRHQIVSWFDQAMSDARKMAVEKMGCFRAL